MNKSLIYHKYTITQQVNRHYAYIDGRQTGFDSVDEAQDAIDAMIARKDAIKKSIGKLRSVPFEEAWNNYLKQDSLDGASEMTLRNKRTALNQLKKIKVITETIDLTKQLFVDWLNTYKDPGTRRQYMLNMRKFIRHCIANNYLIDPKILDIHCAEKKGERGKRAVTPEEIGKINEWFKARKSAIPIIWRIGLETGLRIQRGCPIEANGIR